MQSFLQDEEFSSTSFSRYQKKCQNILVFFVLLAILLSSPLKSSSANSASNSSSNSISNTQLPIDRILQQKNLENQEKKLYQTPVKINQEKLKIDKESKTSDKCIGVSEVFFNGAENLNIYHKKNLSKLVIGKCLDALAISNFLKEVTNNYINRGYSNARAYLEKYDVESKSLYLVIAEGKISSITLKNINPDKSESEASIFDKSQMFFAFPSSKGEIFNIRDFEQGISNLNRLRSNNATIESRPSEIAGESDIIINNYRNNSGGLFHGWQTAVNYENTGSKSTGMFNTTYSVSKDNLLAINDNISFSQVKSDRSETNMISVSIPFEYWNFRYNNSSNKYNSFTSSRVRVEGTSTNHDLSLERLIFRGKVNELTLNSNLNFRNQTRKVAGVVDLKSQRLSTARVGFDYVLRHKIAVANFSFLYSKGLKIHDAIDDQKDFSSPLNKDAARAQFEKYTYNLNLYKPITESLSYNLQATVQHSPDALYSSEIIYVGGNKFSVRGLQYDGIYGSKRRLF